MVFVMKMSSSRTVFPRISFTLFLHLITCFVVDAADAANWSGVYVNKKHLKGQAYFQLGIQQSGNSIRVVFNAAYTDGHGSAPEGHGSAKPVKEWQAGIATGKDTLEFTFQDSCKNSGSGTIKRAGNDIIVDFVFASAVDKRCLDFYGRNMHLGRVGKN